VIRAVTAYVPIPGHSRSEAEYRFLGDKLREAIGDKLLVAEQDLDDCWLFKYLTEHKLKPTHSVADNPRKNSLAYHIVQAEKTELLYAAATVDPFTKVFVWIDYGIFHIPGITEQIIRDFLDRAESEQAIAIPGCWHKDDFVYDDHWPCWRFCGGVMVVPACYAESFHFAMVNEYGRWLGETNNVSWEVNTLARLEQQDPVFPVWWYQADHDKSIFTHYRSTEYADGTQVRGFQGRPC
jgi:hypothetical protein